jgi:hypothetical protein
MQISQRELAAPTSPSNWHSSKRRLPAVRPRDSRLPGACYLTHHLRCSIIGGGIMSILAKTRGFLRAATCQRNARRPGTDPTEGNSALVPRLLIIYPYLHSGLPSPQCARIGTPGTPGRSATILRPRARSCGDASHRRIRRCRDVCRVNRAARRDTRAFRSWGP